MADPTPAPGKASRSGCALALGVSLIAIGLLFLIQNFYSYSLLGVLRASVRLFADYWPALLLVWGASKVYRNIAAPQRSRVSALEIFLLFLIIGTGLTLRAALRVMDQIGTENPLDELFSIAGVDVLRGPAHRFTEQKTYDLAPDAQLLFESSQSNVTVTGWDEPSLSVLVTKLVHDPSEDEAARVAGEVELRFEAGDDSASSPAAKVEARDSGSSDRRKAWSRLTLGSSPSPGRVDVDVELRLPRTAALMVHNRGPVQVSDLSSPLEIATADGAVEVWNVASGLKAKTRHGDMRVENASGNLDLENQDGEVRVTHLSGDLKAETRQGGIQVEEVSGRAILRNRHGSIHVSGIGDRVEIDAEHTEVSVEKVQKSVSIATSHQPIFVRGVDGNLTIDARSSTVQALEIQGDVTVGDRGEPVTIAKVRGSVNVKSRESRVTTDEIEGPLTIETSNEDVRVGYFGSTLSVQSTHSAIDVWTSHLLGNVSLQTTYGAVELRLPSDASIRFRASTKDGEVRSRIPELELHPETEPENEEQRWIGTLGAGTYQVTVETSYADVLVGEPES